MNEQTKPPQPLSIDQARATLHTSIQTAIAAHERALFSMGYDTGFNAGWDAAVRRFSAMTTEKPEPAPPPALVDLDSPAKEIVLRIVQQTPGLRGFEIVDAAAKAGSPLNERTVRTALHRLKTSVLIRNDDGQWFAVADDESAAA